MAQQEGTGRLNNIFVSMSCELSAASSIAWTFHTKHQSPVQRRSNLVHGQVDGRA